MEEIKKKAKWTPDYALSEMRRWCAAQERCHQDIRTKLIEHQVYGESLENIISDLISEGFLNEMRYANAFVSGKYRINKWGVTKIKYALKAKNISDYCINAALANIEQDEYEEGLKKLIEKKIKTIKYTHPFELKKKLTSYLLQKGYTYENIKEGINSVLKKQP